MMKRFPLALAAIVATSACGGSSPPEATPPGGEHADHDHADAEHHHHDTGSAQPGADLTAAETAAFDKAKPVFDKHCARCHTKDGKDAKPKSLEHFDMSAYPFGGHHADEITGAIRKVLAIGGGKATMPLDHPGAVTGDELALIAAWADAYDRADAAGAHGEHEHGKEHHHHDDGDHHDEDHHH